MEGAARPIDAVIGDRVFTSRLDLSNIVPLVVTLVRGTGYAVWIDTGIKSMFPQLVEAMRLAGVQPSELRFVLNTHSHHDHIGCNYSVSRATRCLVAAPGLHADWHSDFEAQFQGFARAFPDLVPDTPELRDVVFSTLDHEKNVDLHLRPGMVLDLGGGVCLEAYPAPGHMRAEIAWLETSTRTLIVGDAVTGLDWPIFHGHVSVAGYRGTLRRLGHLVDRRHVVRVILAHYGVLEVDEFKSLIEAARTYLDSIDRAVLAILDGRGARLEDVWDRVCMEMRREKDFRALTTVFAHLEELVGTGAVKRTERRRYSLVTA